MRREPLFSRAGFYGFLLECNALLHRQATAGTIAAVRPLLETAAPGPVPVLDLACGGWPSTVAEVLGAFPGIEFHYWGVDINPDQVAQARERFRFPANVAKVRVLEGNAWEPDTLDLPGGFPLIYSGMNLHHGTPEELWFLAGQIAERLNTQGRFVSHDVYRPALTPYLRRPDADPLRPAESWRLVAPRRLAAGATIPDPVDEGPAGVEPAWRLDYLERMARTLSARGAEPEGAASTVAHMRQRDYPVSTDEFRRLFRGRGLTVDVQTYAAPEEPMAPYIALCTACRAA